MSWDVELLDPATKKIIKFDKPHQMSGGTMVMGGTNEAWLNITYNYAPHYREIGEKGLRSIQGMSGEESLPLLKKAADRLSDDVNPDYWTPSEGNAKRALLHLIAFAKMRPDGVWDVY